MRALSAQTKGPLSYRMPNAAWTLSVSSSSPPLMGLGGAAASANASPLAPKSCTTGERPPASAMNMRLPNETPVRSAKCWALARASPTAAALRSSMKGFGSSTVKLMPLILVASPPALAHVVDDWTHVVQDPDLDAGGVTDRVARQDLSPLYVVVPRPDVERAVWMSVSVSPWALTAATMAAIAVAAWSRASATVRALASTPMFTRARSGSSVILPCPVTQMPTCELPVCRQRRVHRGYSRWRRGHEGGVGGAGWGSTTGATTTTGAGLGSGAATGGELAVAAPVSLPDAGCGAGRGRATVCPGRAQGLLRSTATWGPRAPERSRERSALPRRRRGLSRLRLRGSGGLAVTACHTQQHYRRYTNDSHNTSGLLHDRYLRFGFAFTLAGGPPTFASCPFTYIDVEGPLKVPCDVRLVAATPGFSFRHRLTATTAGVAPARGSSTSARGGRCRPLLRAPAGAGRRPSRLSATAPAGGASRSVSASLVISSSATSSSTGLSGDAGRGALAAGQVFGGRRRRGNGRVCLGELLWGSGCRRHGAAASGAQGQAQELLGRQGQGQERAQGPLLLGRVPPWPPRSRHLCGSAAAGWAGPAQESGGRRRRLDRRPACLGEEAGGVSKEKHREQDSRHGRRQSGSPHVAHAGPDASGAPVAGRTEASPSAGSSLSSPTVALSV